MPIQQFPRFTFEYKPRARQQGVSDHIYVAHASTQVDFAVSRNPNTSLLIRQLIAWATCRVRK